MVQKTKVWSVKIGGWRTKYKCNVLKQYTTCHDRHKARVLWNLVNSNKVNVVAIQETKMAKKGKLLELFPGKWHVAETITPLKQNEKAKGGVAVLIRHSLGTPLEQGVVMTPGTWVWVRFQLHSGAIPHTQQPHHHP